MKKIFLLLLLLPVFLSAITMNELINECPKYETEIRNVLHDGVDYKVVSRTDVDWTTAVILEDLAGDGYFIIEDDNDDIMVVDLSE